MDGKYGYLLSRYRSKGLFDIMSLACRKLGHSDWATTLANILARQYRRNYQTPRLKAIQIETLSFCNYKCSFCPTNQIAMPKGVMSLELFTKIVDDLAEFNGEIRLYLRNEPLIDKRIVTLAKIAKESTRARVKIQTNGALLTETLAKQLSPYAEIVVNDYTDDQTVVAKIATFAKRYNIITSNRSISDGLTNRAGNLPLSQEKLLQAFCVRPFEQMYIAYDGRVVLCCQDWKLEEVLGDATEQSITKIWTGDKYIEKRKQLLDRNRTNLCSKCDFPGV
jgi:radical SAM protein with 4Fe4S-binding SPASM domain